jgi:hypothetical protein
MLYRSSRKFGCCWLVLKRPALGEVEALGDTWHLDGKYLVVALRSRHLQVVDHLLERADVIQATAGGGDVFRVTGGLYRQEQVAVHQDGWMLSALAYVATEGSEGNPRSGYLELIIAAARRWKFPAEYVEELCTWMPR